VTNLDKFDWLGIFSAGLHLEYNGSHDQYLATVNDTLDLFWIGIGKTDFLWDRNQNLLKVLGEKNIKHTSRISEGGHTWKNWRLYLFEYSQLLFK